ncbi:hypothetical protein F4810DRAFT_372436 [Camillea tinctor]|nr:hypothetical protein F4810DRAFT_372436 [Camillea tinctor]
MGTKKRKAPGLTDNNRDTPMNQSAMARPDAKPRLACHFYKKNCHNYHKCAQRNFDDIGHLMEHLRDKHSITLEATKKRMNPDIKWFLIWEQIFTSSPRPDSAYFTGSEPAQLFYQSIKTHLFPRLETTFPHNICEGFKGALSCFEKEYTHMITNGIDPLEHEPVGTNLQRRLSTLTLESRINTSEVFEQPQSGIVMNAFNQPSVNPVGNSWSRGVHEIDEMKKWSSFGLQNSEACSASQDYSALPNPQTGTSSMLSPGRLYIGHVERHPSLTAPWMPVHEENLSGNSHENIFAFAETGETLEEYNDNLWQPNQYMS